MEMTALMKSWLKELYEEAAKEYHEHSEFAASCAFDIFGDDDDNETLANDLREFACILEKMASEIDV